MMKPYTADQFCVFRVEQAWLGLSAAIVREVLPCPEITAVPASSPVLVGICHVRNEFMAVVDLSAVPVGNRARRSHMLVVMGESGPWGWLVDEVLALTTLEVSRGKYPDSEPIYHPIVLGTAAHQNASVLVIDSDKAMHFAEKTIAEQWNSTIAV